MLAHSKTVVLTDEQIDGIEDLKNHNMNMLFLAEAGSGKSTWLVHAAQHSVDVGLVSASEIMIVSFTTIAGASLRAKLTLPIQFCGTFHAMSAQELTQRGVINMTTEVDLCDGLLLKFIEFLRSNTKEALAFKHGIKMMFIDEMQDNNDLMVQLAKEFSENSRIIAIGDDNQSIMSFQGSSIRHIREFAKTFHPCKVYHLTVNFRCPTSVVNLASTILSLGDVSKMIPKPKARSCEEWRWDQAHTPLAQRVSKSERPILRFYNNDQHCVDRVVEDVEKRMRDDPSLQGHDFAILARGNGILQRLRSRFLTKAIPSVLLRQITQREKRAAQQGNGNDHDTANEITHNKVVLSTVHGAKGAEFLHVYIVGLSAFEWPSSREIDVEAERRLLYVGVTRTQSTLRLYCHKDQPSLFIKELYDAGHISNDTTQTDQALVHCVYLPMSLTNPTEDQEEQQLKSKKRKSPDNDALTWTPGRDLPWFVKTNELVKNMNACGYRKIQEDSLPQPMETKLTTVPVGYDDHIFMTHGGDVSTLEKHGPDMELITPFSHSTFIEDHGLQLEVDLFLNCYAHRYLQQLRRENGQCNVGNYSYAPASTDLDKLMQEGLHIDINRKRQLLNSYALYQDPENETSSILLHVWNTAAFSLLRKGNLTMLYVQGLTPKRLEHYKPQIMELESTIRYLLFATTHTQHTALRSPEHAHTWKEYSFLDMDKVSPDPYIIVGDKQKRLLMLSNEVSEFGCLSQESVMRALVYASICKELCNKPIEEVQVYNTYSRRLCTVALHGWDKHRHFVDQLRTLKRDDYYDLARILGLLSTSSAVQAPPSTSLPQNPTTPSSQQERLLRQESVDEEHCQSTPKIKRQRLVKLSDVNHKSEKYK